MKTPLIEPLEARIAPAFFAIVSPAGITEGNDPLVTQILDFTITLSAAAATDASVSYTTVDATATVANNDYDFTSGTLVIPAGQTSGVIHVPVRGDTVFEGTETFKVKLSNPSAGHTLIPVPTRNTATGTILNDDAGPVPTVSIADPLPFDESFAGLDGTRFTVTLSNESTSPVTVVATTVGDGTATSGVDFTAKTQTITFAPGETSKQFVVTIIGDLIHEPNETFHVVLSSPTNATLGTVVSATGTIANDDPVPTISIAANSLTLSTLEGNSASQNLVFTVNLSNPSSADITVNAATTAGTATEGTDYTPVSQLLTFKAGETSKTISVSISGDLSDEGDETFSLDLSTPSSNATLGAGTHAVGTILNDDLTLSVADVSKLESNGDTTLTFNVMLSQASGHEVKVNFETIDGTAVSTGAGKDFDLQTGGVLTFAPGQTSLPVNVVVHGDLVPELDENFFLKLSSATSAVISRDQAKGTILNDDGDVANLSIGDVRVLEGGPNSAAQAVFTVTLDHRTGTDPVTVQVATSGGNATAGSDYTALGLTTLTFLAGETTKQISVPITGDTTAEGNETFLVKLTNPSSNAALIRDTGTATILNDDGLYFTVNNVTVTEGDSGNSNAVFLVTLNGTGATSAVKVHVATEAGSASSSGSTADFSAITDQTLTFAVGTTQQLVSVPIHGDLIRESTEDFILRLSAATGGGGTEASPADAVTIAKDAGVGTILDNNDPLPTVSIASRTFAEGNAGTPGFVFTATLSAPSDSAVTVNYFTHDITGAAHPAVGGGDYQVSNGTVTFAPGETSRTFSIPVFGDTTNEFDETFGVTLDTPTGATLGTAEGIGTIQNDEVTVSIADVTTVEGNGGTTSYLFHVTLSGAVENAVTVNFATEDGTAISIGTNKDFNEAHGTLTFAPGGALAQDISVTVIGDLRFEGNESFFVNLLSSTNATIVTAKGTGTIQDDDAVTISIQDAASITEGDSGTSDQVFTVSLDHASDLPVTVKVNSVNGTALATVPASGNIPAVLNDFTGITNQTITFAPGETTKTVTVKVVGDTTDELKSEDYTLKLSAPTNATLGNDTGRGTIIDNDLRTVSISDATVIEGDAGTKTMTFTVSLSSASQQAIAVDFSTADNGAIAGQDYVENHGTLTFAANETSRTISVTVNGDATLENNEQFLVNLLSSPNAKISTTDATARGTIVDDDAGGARLKLVPVAGTEFTEGNLFAEFNVVRSGSLTQALTVEYETVDGTAHAGATGDFAAKSGRITFAAGSHVASGTIRVAIQDDTNFENDETFQIRLFNPVNAAILDGGNLPAVESRTVVTIHPDADAAPTLSVADVRVVEGDAGTQQMQFKVRLSAANETQTVTVAAVTAGGTVAATAANSATATALLSQDYVAKTTDETLTFAPGEIEKSFFVTINGDTIHETSEENFQVKLSGATNASVTRATAIGTIADNDAAPTLTLVGTSGTTVTVDEGDAGVTNATFTVQLSNKSELPLSVEFTTKDGTAISDGASPDFTALNHQLLTYTPGGALDSLKISVAVNGDTQNEAAETFTVELSNVQGGTIGTKTGTVSITNDDPVPVVTVNDVSLSEGDSGTSEMVFTVSLSAASGQAVSVDFKTADGTASSTGPMADFLAKTGTVKFAAGETHKEVRIVINGDTFKEQDEKLSLNISNAMNGEILAATGTGTILRDGDTSVGIAIRDAFGVEGNAGTSTISFTVELSDSLAAATTFRAVSTGGTAARGSDFAALAATPFTIAAGTKTATVPVTVNGDNVFEATENFFVGLSNVASAGTTFTIAGGAARGTIFNDDLLQVNSRTIQFIDVDGDLATVHLSKGSLTTSNLSFGTPNAVGGRQLQFINLTGNNTQYQNADVSVTARAQPGFRGDANGVQADGFVNVGAIYAALVQQDILEFVNGIDLGTVTIDGDLGKIHVGDTTATSAVKSLVVRSMGKFGTNTQGTGSGLNTTSLVLGPVDNFHVLRNFQGTFQVVGSQFGLIRNLQIDGALLGGSAASSGEIFVTGRVVNALIGSIVGGSGDSSGSIVGSPSTASRIVNLHVIGNVTGGSGVGSGVVNAATIGKVRMASLVGGGGERSGGIQSAVIDSVVVTKDIIGGDGRGSGQVSGGSQIGTVRVLGEIRGGKGDGSGAIVSTNGRIGHLSVFGAIFGGEGGRSGNIGSGGAVGDVQIGSLVGAAGSGSGSMEFGGNVSSLKIFGDVLGGNGDASGGVYVRGKLFNGLVSGSIVGSATNVAVSPTANALSGSGFILAHRIQDLTVSGNLDSGGGAGAAGTANGWIRSETTISQLHIHGSVTGTATAAARIVALGDTTGPAIRTLIIDGDAKFADILGGYSFNPTAANPRGTPTNADAQIQTVSIGGDLQSTNIVAGVAAGTDGLFGTTDDVPIGGGSGSAVSKIARIIIGGNVLAGTRSSGIEAQYVQLVSVHGSAFSLNPGAGNDGAPGAELVSGSKIRVFEVPVA